MPRGVPAVATAGAAALPAALREALARALAAHGVFVPEGPEGRATALLPVLHHLQDSLGHVPPALVPEIALAFNLSRAEVHGVVTYYHHYRAAPAGRAVVQICQAEACRACGAEALLVHAAQALACTPGHTRADGAVTLEATYCLGLCATAPAAMIDGQLHARVTPAQLDDLASGLARTGASS